MPNARPGILRPVGTGLATGATNTFVRQQIKNLRISKGWTQQQLAEAAGMSASSLGCLETGFYRFNLDTVQKIVEALDVDIADVWPPARRKNGVESDLPLRRASDRINCFRLGEVHSLTGAEASCLFEYNSHPNAILKLAERASEPALRVLYSVHLEEKERQLVTQQLQARTLTAPWVTYSRYDRNRRLFLCLKGASVEPWLGNLIERYLATWLTTVRL